MGLEIKAALVMDGPLLDAIYTGECTCGVHKEFGYMVITALRWLDVHGEREGHDPWLVESEAPPLTRQKMMRRIPQKSARFDIIRGQDRAYRPDDKPEKG